LNIAHDSAAVIQILSHGKSGEYSKIPINFLQKGHAGSCKLLKTSDGTAVASITTGVGQILTFAYTRVQ